MPRLPPPEKGRSELRGSNLISWSVGDWCPTRDGSGPATCVALSLLVEWRRGEPPVDIVMRLKTPAAVDDMIQMLLRHKRSVWKDAP